MRALAALVLAAFTAACAPGLGRGGGDILVMGDSVMARNGLSGAAIADGIGRALGREVVSRAVPGAQLDNRSTVAALAGFDIPDQFPGGRWNWIVLNGGANDLGSRCGCGACDPQVDALIAPDGSRGLIPDLIREMRSTGAQVVWMGYYAGSDTGSFAGCRDDLVEMEARIARLAARLDGVWFADAEAVIDRGDPSLFAPDNTHPSPKGSARIGAYLAQVIAAQSPAAVGTGVR